MGFEMPTNIINEPKEVKKVAESEGEKRPKIDLESIRAWKTKVVETDINPKNVEAAKEALEELGFDFELAGSLLDNLPFGEQELGERKKFELVVSTPAELGLASSATFDEIADAAYEQGLDTCPDEATFLALKASSELLKGGGVISNLGEGRCVFEIQDYSRLAEDAETDDDIDIKLSVIAQGTRRHKFSKNMKFIWVRSQEE